MFSISAPYSLLWALNINLRKLNLRRAWHCRMQKHHLFMFIQHLEKVWPIYYFNGLPKYFRGYSTRWWKTLEEPGERLSLINNNDIPGRWEPSGGMMVLSARGQTPDIIILSALIISNTKWLEEMAVICFLSRLSLPVSRSYFWLLCRSESEI